MPITARSKTCVKVFSRQLSFNSVVQLLVLLDFSSYSTLLRGQTIEIKLVNGRKDAIAILTNKNGGARLRLTDNDGEVDIHNRWRDCGEFGVISPVVKYEDFIKVNVPYVVCKPHGTDHSWLEVKSIPTRQVVQGGVVTANTCGKAINMRKPGELIIFVRPLSFWEELK